MKYLNSICNIFLKFIVTLMVLLFLLTVINIAYNSIFNIEYNSLELWLTQVIMNINHYSSGIMTRVVLFTIKVLSISYIILFILLLPLIILIVKGKSLPTYSKLNL